MANIRSFMDVNPNAGSPSPLSTNYSPSGRVDSSMPNSLFAGNLGDFVKDTFPVASVSGSGSAFGGMMTSLIPSLLGSLGSSALNALFAKLGANRQFDMNKSLMDYQNKLQRDMLTDEMALKMQGYKNAGLSTASLAGNFGGNVAVPSSSVSATQAQAHDPKLGDIMNAARQVKLQEDAIQSQIDLNEANAEAARANAESAYANAGKTDIEAYLLDTYGSRKYEADIAQLDAQEKKTLADRDYTVQKKLNEMNINEKEVQLLQQQYDINWKRLPKELALLSAQAFRETQQGKLAQKTQDEVQQKIYNLQRERDNIIRNGYMTDVQTELIEAEIARIAAENANIGPAALYGKAKSYLMEKFPNLVKAGVVADTAISYIRNFAEIYSMFSGRGGGTTTTYSSGTGPKGNWSSTTTTTRK